MQLSHSSSSSSSSSRGGGGGGVSHTQSRSATVVRSGSGVCDVDDTAKATPVTHAPPAAAAAAAAFGPCPVRGPLVPETWLLLQQDEQQAPLSSDYHRHQPEVHPSFRASLVNWLTQLHSRYRMRDETLFRAVDILDRLLNNREHRIARSWLQVMGLAAFLMASKMEETEHPSAADLVILTDRVVTEAQVTDAETAIVQCTKLQVAFPLSIQFLEMLLTTTFRAAHASQRGARKDTLDELRHRAHYLLELSLHDNASLDYRPSKLAAAAFVLAQVTMPALLEDPRLLASVAGSFERASGGYSLLDLVTCMLHVHKLVQQAHAAPAVQQHYVVRKYSKPARGAVATKRFDVPLTTTPPTSPLLALPSAAAQSSSSSHLHHQHQLSVVDRDYNSFG